MIVLIMGVAGSGKTTVGRLLAAELGWSFFDADDFHPSENVAKMANGIPLTDADRQPWLDALAEKIRACLAMQQSAMFAVSALKQAYRDVLTVDAEQVRTVYLKGEPSLIRQRMQQRPDHFFKPDLLQTQFDALEEPDDAMTLDIASPPDVLVQRIRQQLGGLTSE
jgi:gluconokinase